ncbi:Monocarboxylate transporter 5, partial [Stegodyphus mimosarum]
MVPDDYVKLNAKKMSATSLTPPLLEKNEIFSVANAPLKAFSATNLTSNFEEKLKSEERCDNLSFSSENEINKVSLEKRLSIQNIFPTPEESSDRQTSRNDLREESLKKEIETKQENSHPGKPKGLLENMKTIVRLYKNPVFILLCVCNATYVFIFIPIMTSAVDYARDKGLSEHIGKYLVHAMAVGDIFGRLCFGWVTDQNFITIPHYMILTLVLEGVFIMLLPLTASLVTYLLLLALYSMTAGSMMVRIPVLVYKHVKKDEKSVAMGCYGFASGLVPLGVPSLIGYFRDNKGSYDGMYYIMGSLSILSGGFWLLEPILVRLNNRLEQHREDAIKV